MIVAIPSKSQKARHTAGGNLHNEKKVKQQSENKNYKLSTSSYTHYPLPEFP